MRDGVGPEWTRRESPGIELSRTVELPVAAISDDAAPVTANGLSQATLGRSPKLFPKIQRQFR